jgi:hypothetical protein
MTTLSVVLQVLELLAIIIGFSKMLFAFGSFYTSHKELKENFNRHVEDDKESFRDLNEVLLTMARSQHD